MRFADYEMLNKELSELLLEIDDFSNGELESLSEAVKADIFYLSVSKAIIQKVNNRLSKMKGSSDVKDKLDVAGDLLRLLSSLLLLNIAATTGDKSLYKGSRKG